MPLDRYARESTHWTRYCLKKLSLIIYTFCFQVEFPEARIYEETLNVLLYENRDQRPDAELMQATRGRIENYNSDEDTEEKMERYRRK